MQTNARFFHQRIHSQPEKASIQVQDSLSCITGDVELEIVQIAVTDRVRRRRHRLV